MIALAAFAMHLALNPAVTPQTIGETICVPGWTKTIRPPVAYTTRLKRKQLPPGAALPPTRKITSSRSPSADTPQTPATCAPSPGLKPDARTGKKTGFTAPSAPAG